MSAVIILKDIFTVIGVVAIAGVLLYAILKLIDKYKTTTEENSPINEYMERIGSKCPDGWLYVGDVKDKNNRIMNVCKNLNIPTCGSGVFDPVAKTGCYAKGKEKEQYMYFHNIANWKDYTDGVGDININQDYRCGWLNSCGAPSELKTTGDACQNPNKASWTGLDSLC
jgi:hypothetical protein